MSQTLFRSLKTFVVFSVLAFGSVSTSLKAEPGPLPTVSFVDLERYQGLWYEIASYPKWFAFRCVNSQATYTLNENATVGVVNECRVGNREGRVSKIEGVARVADRESNAKLKVKFPVNPFEGDYWIVELGDHYEYAVVSEPKRKSLWILSRTETLSAEVLTGILDRLKTKYEFDTDRLKFTRE